MKKFVLSLFCLMFVAAFAFAASRNYISIVGSSTVYPFSTTVAEYFGKKTIYSTPKVESTGTGGGFKIFCQGVGVESPDMTNASRAIKPSEQKICEDNGVTPIEVKIGYDGIVIANSNKAFKFNLTRKELFLALAKDVPYNGSWVPNSYKTWSEINPNLPNIKIEVLGPPPTSGTRDAFLELVMEKGALEFEFLAKMKKEDKKKFKSMTHAIREDGAYIEAGENDNLIIQKLVSNENALGIFGFSFLDQNMDKIHGAKIEGIEPTFEGIADGSYPVSRPLFFYAKKEHMDAIPGMREFIEEFTSEQSWGEDGYLSEKGLIPLPADEKEKVLKNLNM